MTMSGGTPLPLSSDYFTVSKGKGLSPQGCPALKGNGLFASPVFAVIFVPLGKALPPPVPFGRSHFTMTVPSACVSAVNLPLALLPTLVQEPSSLRSWVSLLPSG